MLAILLILALVLFTFLICPAFRVDLSASSDPINLGTPILTLLGLGVAFGTLYLAIGVYRKSIQVSAEHEQSMEANRPQFQHLWMLTRTNTIQHEP